MQNNSLLAASWQLKLLVGCITFSLLMLGCNKKNADATSSSYDQKILAYLESQKIVSKSPSAAVNKANRNIELLKNNLDFSLTRTESLDDETELLVVPVKEGLITEKNLDKNSALTLLLMINNQKKIVSGNIVYFQSSDQKKYSTLPENTLSNLLNGKEVPLDGTYKMLTLSGTWLSQFGVKEKNLSSVGAVENRNASSIVKGKTNNATCTQWYLTTSYYSADASITQAEEYLGIICAGDCGKYSRYATIYGIENDNRGDELERNDIIIEED